MTGMDLSTFARVLCNSIRNKSRIGDMLTLPMSLSINECQAFMMGLCGNKSFTKKALWLDTYLITMAFSLDSRFERINVKIEIKNYTYLTWVGYQ